MVLSVHPGSVIGEKVLYVGSSISYHCDFDVLRNEIGAEVITRFVNYNLDYSKCWNDKH